jgi:hypothetical protein
LVSTSIDREIEILGYRLIVGELLNFCFGEFTDLARVLAAAFCTALPPWIRFLKVPAKHNNEI